MSWGPGFLPEKVSGVKSESKDKARNRKSGVRPKERRLEHGVRTGSEQPVSPGKEEGLQSSRRPQLENLAAAQLADGTPVYKLNSDISHMPILFFKFF